MYTVRVRRRRGIKQQFHVIIESRWNGEPLFWSENLKNKSYAVGLAEDIATDLDARLVDET